MMYTDKKRTYSQLLALEQETQLALDLHIVKPIIKGDLCIVLTEIKTKGHKNSI